MPKEKLLIQNILLHNDVDINIQDYFEFMYFPNKVIYNALEKCHIIERGETINFTSYLNSLQVNKWKTYTNAKSFGLTLEFKGDATLEIFGFGTSAKNIDREIIKQIPLSSETKTIIDIDFGDTTKKLVCFRITTHSDFCIYNGNYYAYVEKEDIKDVRISLATTTFRKEAYIKKNIALLKSKILCDESPIKDNIFVHVIDNGRTLDPSEIDGKNIKVYPNANVGGAGGFTRGMIEAMESEFNPTHVLLMDDDVMVLSESLVRTYCLLRIVKDEYADSFVSGAMFDYDYRERQYEDVGYVNQETGAYGPIKTQMDMRIKENLAKNEEFDVNGKANSYAGWWYCCIPVSTIKENGLPLPVFIRTDDVEYSIRNKGGFITLNGICIWHVGFAGKFNAAMELYQVHRNSFVVQATCGICKDADFLTRIKKLFWQQIAKLAYANAEQLLDSIEDFLKGPDFIIGLNGEACLKEHAGKNEKTVPFALVEEKYRAVTDRNVYEFKRLKGFKRLLYKMTINGHLLPKFMLKNKPEAIAYDWFNSPGHNYMRKTLVAVNPNDATCVVRKMNKKRCFALIKRYRKLLKKYKKNYSKVAKAYRDSFDKMISVDFWKKYLNI